MEVENWINGIAGWCFIRGWLKTKKKWKRGRSPFAFFGQQIAKKGGLDPSPATQTHTPVEREREGTWGAAADRPTHAWPSPTPVDAQTQARESSRQREREKEIEGGGRLPAMSQRLLQGSPAIAFGRWVVGSRWGAKEWTEPIPSQPKSNPKTDPLAWIQDYGEYGIGRN